MCKDRVMSFVNLKVQPHKLASLIIFESWYSYKHGAKQKSQ